MVFPGTIPPRTPAAKHSPKRCPLCGSPAQTARMLTLGILHVPRYMAWCRECGYYGPVRLTKRGAIRVWNKRKENDNG